MQKQPRSLIDLCLRVITDIEHLKELTRFEAIRERMFHVFDCQLQQYLLSETKTWHDNGQLRKHAHYYHDGRLHGECRKWYSTGVQREVSTFHRGMLHGEHRDWYFNGALRCHANYVDGRLDGECCWWFSDGTVEGLTLFDDGYIKQDLP